MLKPFYQKNIIEAGCDEAGRGCLAGPVFAAAVIIPKHFRPKALNDSKKLSEKKRNALRLEIEKECPWAVASVDPEEIDEINILNASFLAMHRALDQLKENVACILVDGNRFTPYKNIEHHCIIKGDAKYLSIAAASVLAKTHRDQFMQEAHKQYPLYQWQKNKGYPTKAHRQAIAKHGASPLHRKSFRLLPLGEQSELFS